jgi:hypothetical protein
MPSATSRRSCKRQRTACPGGPLRYTLWTAALAADAVGGMIIDTPMIDG